ncbi:Hypothetical predicted protein [Cloeon dipterum]|uniref:Peptidase S1 domain-containing protein n=1 Tax=Cloeon dipterum TaxID=197152 RepID=A0A8S1D5C9_9INSE|nr:Hypothetical predicted protein [Cloeon dipterum]
MRLLAPFWPTVECTTKMRISPILCILLSSAKGKLILTPGDNIAISQSDCQTSAAIEIFSHRQENLSFEGCGLWNRNVSSEPPWNILLFQDQTYGSSIRVPCRCVILSDRTLLSVSDDSCDLTALLFERGIQVSIYKKLECPITGDSDCLKDKLNKKVLNATRVVIGGKTRYLWTVERLMLNERFNPICLFNQGRSINSRQTLQNDLATRLAKRGTQCFSDIIYRKYCHILETIICSDDFGSDYLVTIVGSRFFLWALTQSAIQEPPISFASRRYKIFERYFYSDIVADIPTIISASCDLAMMPIAIDSPPKINFDKKTMGHSFPGCGMIVNGANRRPKRSDVDGYIHKGEPAARGRSPWHASLSKIKYGFLWRDFCGATLITERAAITAAHCLFDEGELLLPAKILVNFESFDLSARSDFERQTLKPDGYMIYPRYRHSHRTFEHDIAILIFSREKKVRINDIVMPVCLWNGDNDFNIIVNKTGMVTGRGFTENYTLPDTVRTADLRIASYQECFESNRKMASTYLKPNQNFCAGHPKNGTNVCNGDSGSGLIIQNEGRFYLRGIVSFGPTRKVKVKGQDLFVCNPFQFSVFTDITFYLKWIAQSVPDLNKPTPYL